jgi:Glycosyl transferase family 2
MTAGPRVSVCIPTRDHAPHLRAAIASALAQDVDLEVLVHDDASRDATPAVVAQVADPRVRYRRHPEPIGVAANRNSCLAGARGTYIAWLDADDEYLPGGLARQVAVLDRHPGVALVHGGYQVIDVDGRPLPPWPAPFDGDTVEPSAAAFRHLIAANEMATSTVVVRRSAHDAAGPFATDVGASSTDWDMWLRLALHGDIGYTAGRVARYRQHGRSISRATSLSGERLRCDVRVAARALRDAAPRLGDTAELAHAAGAALAAKALLHAGDAYTSGRRPEAFDAVALAGRLAPGTPVDDLLGATLRGDDVACQRLTKAALDGLGERLDGTRFGAKVRRAAAPDAAWDAELARVAAAVACVTPADAVLATIAKWDPTISARSGRRGYNYPDRELLPDGYPRDGSEAVAHLEALRRSRGVTHLVVPSVSSWWMEHYPELALHVGSPLWDGDPGAIFDVRGRL